MARGSTDNVSAVVALLPQAAAAGEPGSCGGVDGWRLAGDRLPASGALILARLAVLLELPVPIACPSWTGAGP